MKRYLILFLLAGVFSFCIAQSIPARPNNSIVGSVFMASIKELPFHEREQLIKNEILSGNIPDFLRNMIQITSIFKDAENNSHIVTYLVMGDYLSIGSNSDYCRVPMGPYTAQAIADSFGCILTTTKLCDDVWRHARVKLEPIPYYPVADNNSQVYKFIDHNSDINSARESVGGNYKFLIAGIKKDIVICNALQFENDKVAIYGWHYLNGKAIQPLYTGHVDWYVDYSHGVRLVNETMLVDGKTLKAQDILADPVLYKLLSDDDEPMKTPRY